MTKDLLNDYIDACELIKETEEDIQKLRKQETVCDKVRGSNPYFPYQPQSFSVTGVLETRIDTDRLKEEKELLQQRKDNAKCIKSQVERWMNKIPVRMQRIIRYKFFEGFSWEQVAAKVGKKATGESVKKEFQRFMKEN